MSARGAITTQNHLGKPTSTHSLYIAPTQALNWNFGALRSEIAVAKAMAVAQKPLTHTVRQRSDGSASQEAYLKH